MSPENFLLFALSPESRKFLVSRSTPVALPLRKVLYVANETPTHAYFPTSGLASIVTSMVDGATAEVNFVGREGVVGAFHLLGPAEVPTNCFVQMEGAALKISIVDLKMAFEESEEIRQRILENVQEQALTVAQIAACNRLHESQERLARWLLMAQDCTQSDVLNITQEFLAEMLGSRRTTVTVVAGALQRSGYIEYRRGHIKILDRKRLETAACDCYRVIKHLYDSLYKDVAGAALRNGALRNGAH
ncbi:MAG TPA: Crp/Fnr family transcriptional regulator [Edaphobacter sp.]|nr:Crp/Fnr family transcriptional regulator [Edaphobacter sp.]